ncbi:MAG: hypothetical protein HHAS10_02960 [Candidatus Altimarinota bacterium]
MLCILAYHLNQIRPIQNLALWDWKLYQFVSMFPVVVSIFFILAGFLRSLSYWKVIFDGGEIPPFWKGLKERFFRIAPLFYIALISSFLWSIWLGNQDYKSFFVGFSFLSWAHPSTFFPVAINGPLWFVAYDMMGNILVMIFMMKLLWFFRWLPNKKFSITIIFFTFGFLILLGLHHFFVSLPFPKLDGIVSVWFPYYNPFIFGTYYLFGALLAGFYFWLRKLNFEQSLIFDFIFVLIFATIGVFLYQIRSAPDLAYSSPISPYRYPLVPLLFGLSLFALLFSRYFANWIDNRFFLFIAEISYPFYLFHALILVVVQEFLFPTLGDFTTWTLLSISVITISVILSMLLIRLEKVWFKFLKKH